MARFVLFLSKFQFSLVLSRSLSLSILSFALGVACIVTKQNFELHLHVRWTGHEKAILIPQWPTLFERKKSSCLNKKRRKRTRKKQFSATILKIFVCVWHAECAMHDCQIILYFHYYSTDCIIKVLYTYLRYMKTEKSMQLKQKVEVNLKPIKTATTTMGQQWK